MSQRLSERAACSLIVGLLDVADWVDVVAGLAAVLGALHERGQVPDIDVLHKQFAPRPTLMPLIRVDPASRGRVRPAAGGCMNEVATRTGPVLRACQ